MRILFSTMLAGVMLVAGLCTLSVAADKAEGHAVTSDKGLYRVSYASRVDPVPLNTIHAWEIEVRDAQGKPVTGARIGIDGGMPAHGHGLPTKPRMTQELGGGSYLVDGLKFQMPGEWVIDLAITADSGTDTARIDLSLGAKAGHSGHQH